MINFHEFFLDGVSIPRFYEFSDFTPVNQNCDSRSIVIYSDMTPTVHSQLELVEQNNKFTVRVKNQQD